MLKNLKEKIALTYGDDQISFSNLMGKIELYASQYTLGKGERAVIFSENRPAWIYAFYSIWLHSGTVVPIDFGFTVSEIAYILKDSQPSVVFVSEEGKDKMEKAIQEAEILVKLILINENEGFDRSIRSEKDISMPTNTEDTAIIIYTSGTTGSPKGVVLSYKNLLTNIWAVSEVIPIFRPDSRTMVLLPLHHILPLLGSVVAPLQVGGMIAISPSMASEDIMNTLQKNKITIIIGVPRLYSAIRKGIKDKINASFAARTLFSLAEKLQSSTFSRLVFGAVHKKFGGEVKHLVAGGAALDPEVGADYQTLGFEVLEGYGMTEAAPMITFTRPGRVRIGSPGEAMPGTDIRIVDGEITASGDNIMKGYYNRPEETAEVLRDGWLFTGDLGYMDKDGYLYITGRKKEIIITSSGKNVNPLELEEKLLTYPEVSDCGVFFLDNQIQAVIIAKVNELSSKELYSQIREDVIEPFNNSVSSYKKILKFYLTEEELPRTKLGKLQRFKLPAFAAVEQSDISETDEPQSEEFKLIASYLKREKSKTIKPQHHLELDLGLDSLDRVALQAYLYQSFGVDLEANEINQFNTVGKLSAFVADKKTKMEEGGMDWKAILKEKIHFKLPKFWLTNTLMMRMSKFFFKLYFRFTSKGEEHIPEGPCIIAPNHQSFFDGLFVTALLKTKQIRNTFFYAKSQHVKLPFLKFLANKNNIIVVDLNKNLKESIQKLAEVLKQEKKLLIFPEGTRSLNGDLGQFKKTFAILSSELNVPIVPVSISGAINALPKGSFFPRPGKKVQIEFLKPIYPKDNSYEDITNVVRDKIEERIM